MMEERRQIMLQTALRLFSERNIESVSMEAVAAKTDFTIRSFYRYFNSKDNLVIETAVWAWRSFFAENRENRPAIDKSAAECYAFFLDSFLTLYRKHAELLRFNQYFNVYVKSQRVPPARMRSYETVVGEMREWFCAVFQKGREDGTLRTDAPEAEIFNTTLHLMLAAVTRYAVGLVYTEGADPERELMTLRNMLLREYTAAANG